MENVYYGLNISIYQKKGNYKKIGINYISKYVKIDNKQERETANIVNMCLLSSFA